MTYYNEHDAKCAQWLRELMSAGLIPFGVVDERSIVDVKPYEISEFKQQHFFAGIGGWAYALRLAGWPDERPVRTGSCPCQPYSRATKGKGNQDKRNLWPVFRDIITFGEHTVTFGEQVASEAGREWLSGIRADMEALGYDFGAADLCAACVGSPQIRQRLFWAASPKGKRLGPEIGGLGNSDLPGCNEQCGAVPVREENIAVELRGDAWDRYDLLRCSDGKARRVERGAFPMADGIPGRVGELLGYANAVVPQVAAQFIAAWDSL